MHAPFVLQEDPLDSTQLELSIRRLADMLAYGQEASAFLGAGLEFAQSRPYQHGDPVKAIDWRATARTGRVLVKEYEAPRRMPVYVLIDTSASMALSSVKGTSKYAVAVQIAGALALATLDQTNPVGLLALGSRTLHAPAQQSRQAVLAWLQQLRRGDFTEKTLLGTRLQNLAARLHNTAFLIVLSDLHDPSGVPALRTLAQRHDTAVLHLQDPSELHAPAPGIFRAREAESGVEFASTARRTRRLCNDTRPLTEAGISCLSITVGTAFLPALRHFLSQRSGRRSHAL
jgi:uncharacterized protein (DUF58 family)